MAKATTGSRGGGRHPRRPDDVPDRMIDALMALLAEGDFTRIGLADIADRAGVPLSDARRAFDGKLAIIAGFSRRIDLAVLAQAEAVAADDPVRDRLFDVMMRRFDAFAPYKAALESLTRATRCDPCLAAALHRIAVRAQRWMLAMAGIRASGPRGAAIVEGAVLVQARVMSVWLKEDDPALPKTMAALDRALRSSARMMVWLNALCRLVPSTGRRRGREPDTPEAAAV